MSDMYHYVECGLDYVYLLDIGHKEGAPTDGSRIVKTDLLHHEIAKAVVLSARDLSGPELLFLRNELGLKAKDFCEILGVSHGTLNRWEGSLDVLGRQADTTVRLLYAAACSDGELGRDIVRMLLDGLKPTDESLPATLVFDWISGGWRLMGKNSSRQIQGF